MIKAEHLTKNFGDFCALNNISCTINDGCIYGMVGSNGAGKSTFLRILSGIYRADSGSVTIDGETIWENPIPRSRIAFVPDELYFLPGATMERMALMHRDTRRGFDMRRFKTLAGKFSLNTRAQISTFSKGMKRQAATILALSTNPDYIFFDETFDGLDPIMRNFVKAIICEDVMDRGASAVITSHSLRELEDTCDQLSLLHRGGIVFEQDIANLKTAQFKVQIALRGEYDRQTFEKVLRDADILHFVKHGSVTNMIVRGDRDSVTAALRETDPLILDILPLTLEEVFTYEMEALGYKFEL